MQILNLACGERASADPRVLNIDWSIYLRLRSNTFLRPLAPIVINGERYKKFAALPDNIKVWDLRRGIPCADSSVDAVYHSHFMEHIDRNAVAGLLREVHRVLKPHGIQRIVVPDLEALARAYVHHLDHCAQHSDDISMHDGYVSELYWWSVIREATGTGQQRGLRRWVENLLLGDARARGQTHQWMYDQYNTRALLESCGFGDCRVHRWNTSDIADWAATGLDRNDAESEYKPGSLYMEARKLP
ncbi:MAG: methyltransferase domain-containing protein [Pseudomonadota bacterium]|nr:methyltransferase domain-containing protein [Pseudomonadota bacterium]